MKEEKKTMYLKDTSSKHESEVFEVIIDGEVVAKEGDLPMGGNYLAEAYEFLKECDEEDSNYDFTLEELQTVRQAHRENTANNRRIFPLEREWHAVDEYLEASRMDDFRHHGGKTF